MKRFKQQMFLHSELWILTFGGAFQRAGIYKTEILITEKERSDFRNGLKMYVETHLLLQYKIIISEKSHIENIQKIVDFSTQHAVILSNDTLNFGVAQKLLNLLLKYHWCIGEIAEPPHFPVDRLIQKEIGCKITNWTELNNVTDYLCIIDAARIKAHEKNMTLAMWELVHFQRNNFKTSNS
jgi:hypothetical protein